MDRKWTVLMAEIINDIINKVGGNAAITDYNNYWQKGEHKIIFVEQMMTATEANQLSAWWMDRYGVSTNRWNPRKSQKKTAEGLEWRLRIFRKTPAGGLKSCRCYQSTRWRGPPGRSSLGKRGAARPEDWLLLFALPSEAWLYILFRTLGLLNSLRLLILNLSFVLGCTLL